MVTHQLQVRCRPVKVRRSETDVLPRSTALSTYIPSIYETIPLLYLHCCLGRQVRQQYTSTVDVNPTSPASPCRDETVQSTTSLGSPTTSTNQRSAAANRSPYSRSKLFQPTVLLRHWNGVSNRSPVIKSSKTSEADNGELCRQNDEKDVAVKPGFHYPSSRAELTGVKKCTRVDGPSTRPVNSGRELG